MFESIQPVIKILLFASCWALISCEQESTGERRSTAVQEEVIETVSIDDITVARDFDFSTRNTVPFLISLTNNSGLPAVNISVSIYIYYDEEHIELIQHAQTDGNGEYATNLDIPADVTQLLVISSMMGKHNRFVIPVTSSISIQQ
ncbi:MAG: hypothetical protein GY744_00290 [Gammaproteobacteria bacterium]|nr:hypothetical protein [Gammaproteobacteria bacterium]